MIAMKKASPNTATAIEAHTRPEAMLAEAVSRSTVGSYQMVRSTAIAQKSSAR